MSSNRSREGTAPFDAKDKRGVGLRDRIASLNSWSRKLGKTFTSGSGGSSEENEMESEERRAAARGTDFLQREEDEIAHLRATLDAKCEMWQTNQVAVQEAMAESVAIESRQRRQIEELRAALRKERIRGPVHKDGGDMSMRNMFEAELRVLREEICTQKIKTESFSEEAVADRLKEEATEVAAARKKIAESIEMSRHRALLSETRIDELSTALRAHEEEVFSLKNRVGDERQREISLQAKLSTVRQKYCRAMSARDRVVAELQESELRVRRLECDLSDSVDTIERLNGECLSMKRRSRALKTELRRKASIATAEKRTAAPSTSDDDSDIVEMRRLLEVFYAETDPSGTTNIPLLLSKFEITSKADFALRLLKRSYAANRIEGSGFASFADGDRSEDGVSTLSERMRERMTGVQKIKLHEDDNLLHWGLQQQLHDRERLFEDELSEIAVQQRMLREQQQCEIAKLKNEHELKLATQLELAREKHSEALSRATDGVVCDQVKRVAELKIENEILHARLCEARRESDTSRREAAIVDDHTSPSSLPPPSSQSFRTPVKSELDLDLAIVESKRRGGSSRSARARERMARRRKMRDEEAASLVEASGVTDAGPTPLGDML